MKLKEYMKDKENGVYCIGEQSGYIMCVTPDEYPEHLKYWNDVIYIKNLRLAIGILKRLEKTRAKGRIKKDAQRVAELMEELHLPLQEREVIYTYKQESGDITVKIEGTYTGAFWNSKEYTEKRIV